MTAATATKVRPFVEDKDYTAWALSEDGVSDHDHGAYRRIAIYDGDTLVEVTEDRHRVYVGGASQLGYATVYRAYHDSDDEDRPSGAAEWNITVRPTDERLAQNPEMADDPRFDTAPPHVSRFRSSAVLGGIAVAVSVRGTDGRIHILGAGQTEWFRGAVVGDDGACERSGWTRLDWEPPVEKAGPAVGDEVNTPQELDALPVGVVVNDRDDDKWTKLEDGWHINEAGNPGVAPSRPARYTPLTIVSLPEPLADWEARYNDLVKQVGIKAGEGAKRHGWCLEVDRLLADIPGHDVKRIAPTYRHKVTITFEVESEQEDRYYVNRDFRSAAASLTADGYKKVGSPDVTVEAVD